MESLAFSLVRIRCIIRRLDERFLLVQGTFHSCQTRVFMDQTIAENGYPSSEH